MVPWDKAVATSYKLSIVTMSLSAALWPQFTASVHLNSSYLFTDTGISGNSMIPVLNKNK